MDRKPGAGTPSCPTIRLTDSLSPFVEFFASRGVFAIDLRFGYNFLTYPSGQTGSSADRTVSFLPKRVASTVNEG
jgi:hypothetical protein